MVNLGINIENSCFEKWGQLGRPKSTLKGCLFKLNDDFTKLELVKESDISNDSDSPWSDFVKMLPEDACRFGCFDFELTLKSGATNVPDRTINKIALINWIGQKSPRRERMIHTSTVMPVKMKLDAHIVLTFHGPDDIDLVEIADTIKRKTGSNSHVVSIEKHNL